MKKLFYIIVPVLIIILSIFIFHDSNDHKYYTEVNPTTLSNLISSKKSMLVFFKRDGCSHCEQVNPIVNEYAKGKKIKVYALTINKYKMSKIVDKYNIPGTPVISYFKKGKEEGRIVGGFTKERFVRFLNKHDLR